MNFFLRAATSLAYVGILLGSLYLNSLIFTSVIFAVSTITLWELQKLTKQKTPIAYLFFPLLFGIANYIQKGEVIVLAFASVGVLFLIYFFWNKKKFALSKFLTLILAWFGICAPLVILSLLGEGNPILVLLFFIVIWLNDTGAYLIGSWIGKHPLASTISPNKTIEGSIGGVLFSTTIVLFFFSSANLMDTKSMTVIVLMTATMGILGDLVQSKLKRICGVKNSGKILPGHGGMYDRIDSLLLAIPIYKLLLFLI